MSNKAQTSEERFGLPKQPSDTCPIIDEGIQLLRGLRGYEVSRSTRRRLERIDSLEDFQYVVDEILDEVDQAADLGTEDIEQKFEECRDQACAIREWGQAWKDLAKENIAKVEQVRTPLDGVLLWWHERCDDRFRDSAVYKTCLAPTSAPLPVGWTAT